MNCGNMVETSMQTTDGVNTNNKLEVIDAKNYLTFVNYSMRRTS